MKKLEIKKNILIGIGNSARQDDGLGWAFVDEVKNFPIFKGNSYYRFQLNLEDAELISGYEQVFFVDALSRKSNVGFSFYECHGKVEKGYSTHLLTPEHVLYLCHELYRPTTRAWILSIQGYHWEIKEGLSAKAIENLKQSIKWFTKFISKSVISIT